jgi:S-adenosylmethionine decarboxylase proenzyme
MKPKTLGRHLLVEFYNCSAEFLNDVWGIETAMNQAARACKATIVQSCFHRFMPHGVSGVVVIAESHLAIHTWPEYRYASVDLFTCGDEVDPMIAYEVLKEKLGASTAEIQTLNRGNMRVIENRLSAEAPLQPVMGPHTLVQAEKELEGAAAR